LSPAALVVDETTGQLHAHLETAGASKKAKAKKEKEADVVVVRLHADFLAGNPAKVKGNRESVEGRRLTWSGIPDQYVQDLVRDVFQIYTFPIKSIC
jgi:ribosomal protein L11 methylase PrmA